MVIRNSTTTNNQTMQGQIESMIKSEIGDIEHLPQQVVARIRDVYTGFVPVYVEMIRIKENHPIDWQPTNLKADAEMVEDMLHFFSDYQHITRAFKRLNRQVKCLLTMDRQEDPQRYDEWAEIIVSGNKKRSLMNSIIEE
jgi:hypothetical protein